MSEPDIELYRAEIDILKRALARNESALALMSSLAINPAIPYEFRAMMRSSLGEPPLSPWEAPLEGRRGKHRA